MIIGIDISMLVYRGSGVATYTYNLTKALIKYHPEHQYRLFYSSLRVPKDVKKKISEFRQLGARVYRYPLPPWVLKFLWNKHHLIPVEWLIGKVDVYHSSDYLRPPLKKHTKAITTIHDLTWKVHPEFHTQDIVIAHERKLKKTIRFGDTIIVDSENTKKDLLKYYPEAEKNGIHVMYLGVDARFRPINDQKEIYRVLKKYNVKYPKRYLLYVGAIEPRKNLDTAVQAFAELIKDKNFSDVEFLIVGRAGWKNEELFQLVDELKLKDKVNFVGFVEDEDLPYFYNAAKVFVYLSKYEGFGLPPLEALACKVPVMMYANSSLVEIFKGFSFTKKGGEVNSLKRLLAREKNKSMSYPFTWHNAASQTLALLLQTAKKYHDENEKKQERR